MDRLQLSGIDLPDDLAQCIRDYLRQHSEEPDHKIWSAVVDFAVDSRLSPDVYRQIWSRLFSHRPQATCPMWWPPEHVVEQAHLSRWIKYADCQSYPEFHRWSVTHRSEFWKAAIDDLGVIFETRPTSILENPDDPAIAHWLPGARLNIANSCFMGTGANTAIVYQRPGESIQRISQDELRCLVNRVSNGLRAAEFAPGDSIAVVLPMTALSVPIYLGIVQAGCAVVSIADSFAAPEISNRLRISNAKGVFTYDDMLRSGKQLPIYKRVAQATELPIITVAYGSQLNIELRPQDLAWSEFLDTESIFKPIVRDAHDTINILFSSGTTGDPKAIPWNHLTPIKCAIDGMMHQDIRQGDVVAWPTNLGWMMGPWLIFATLMNRATIAIYEDAPIGESFGRFVQEARVNMLGVVPTLVKAWRNSGCMETFDWSQIHCFSSTGEASGFDDMFYLSSLAGMKPIIEYCGGTEIGGGYITSTVVQPNVAAAFTTPAVGLDFVLLDPVGKPTDQGELFLIPPSIGLSSDLLNRDHYETYYADTPVGPEGQQLRRHGDQMQRLADGVLVAGGRVDDTMNLGGIKVSSAELERLFNRIDGVKESAAVAVSSGDGPDQLVVFAVLDGPADVETLKSEMNSQLRRHLNPLFKVQHVEIIESLPRTASNKVMRRTLRDRLLHASF